MKFLGQIVYFLVLARSPAVPSYILRKCSSPASSNDLLRFTFWKWAPHLALFEVFIVTCFKFDGERIDNLFGEIPNADVPDVVLLFRNCESSTAFTQAGRCEPTFTMLHFSANHFAVAEDGRGAVWRDLYMWRPHSCPRSMSDVRARWRQWKRLTKNRSPYRKTLCEIERAILTSAKLISARSLQYEPEQIWCVQSLTRKYMLILRIFLWEAVGEHMEWPNCVRKRFFNLYFLVVFLLVLFSSLLSNLAWRRTQALHQMVFCCPHLTISMLILCDTCRLWISKITSVSSILVTESNQIVSRVDNNTVLIVTSVHNPTEVMTKATQATKDAEQQRSRSSCVGCKLRCR